jgi:hypothetical protein
MRDRPSHEIALRVCGALGVFLLLALAPACHMLPGSLGSSDDADTPESTASEERAVREAFEALKQNDLRRFRAVSITKADFILRDNGLNEFHDNASYTGSIQKPEEEQEHADNFAAAASGGSRSIDFKRVTFKSLGTVLQKARIDTVDGKSFPFKEYSIVVMGPSGETDTKDLSPRFVVVPWEKGHRVLELRVSGGGGYASEPETDDEE